MKIWDYTLIFSAFIFSLLVNYWVYIGWYSPNMVLLWIFGITCLNLVALKHRQKKEGAANLDPSTLFVLLLPSVVRVALFDLSRIHQDDLLTAYFSAHFDPFKINFFAGVPAISWEWVSQYPSLYFALQKLFFLLTSENLLSVKLSIIPYVLVVSVMIYLISKEIFDRKTALIAVLLYAFMPVSVYFETIAVHFISSTAIYLIFFYFLIREAKQPSLFYAILLGIFTGFNYLFYISSYIALPILILTFLVCLIIKRQSIILRHTTVALLSCLLVVGPFTIFAWRFDNYFLERTKQMSLFTGTYSPYRERVLAGESKLNVFKENALPAIRSLYQDGIGGAGGYWFNQQAFMDRFSLLLFSTGFVLAIRLIFKKRALILVVLTLGASLATLLLSIPPPAYQRLTLAIPFVCLVTAIPFWWLSKQKIKRAFMLSISSLVLLIYVLNSLTYFMRAAETETKNHLLTAANYINANLPDRPIFLAAYPSYVFEKVYYFTSEKKEKYIETNSIEHYLTNLDESQKYVLVVIFPYVNIPKYLGKNPNRENIIFSEEIGILYN